ncbi:glycosyltransferase [Candidatus Parcubacteria bacterium]|nr:MAG: glycosyltransferase [Candidatus Parcubacteria bacterium]
MNTEKRIVIVLPAYNEAAFLRPNVEKLAVFLKSRNLPAKIVIAENGSIDNTRQVAENLAEEFPGVVSLMSLKVKGKGNAVISGWLSNQADIYVYMDSDLSTDLNALPEALREIFSGSDIVIGSRYMRSSRVIVSRYRLFFSFFYKQIIRLVFNSKISDFQCGFKAANRNVVNEIVPRIQDGCWFFDTELLLLAERKMFKIKEIPVNWANQPGRKSKVSPISLSIQNIRKIITLKKRFNGEGF